MGLPSPRRMAKKVRLPCPKDDQPQPGVWVPKMEAVWLLRAMAALYPKTSTWRCVGC